MNLPILFVHIYRTPVIVVTASSFALGALWHSRFLFGKAWEKEINPAGAKRAINAPLVFGGSAVLHLLAVAALSAVVSGHGMAAGLLTGLTISIVWVLPAIGSTYLFGTRSLRLLAIDAGFYVVFYSLAGLVLGIW